VGCFAFATSIRRVPSQITAIAFFPFIDVKELLAGLGEMILNFGF
jgi:hypothetical protein